jgi:MoaA/NifB/PqqE/SkfB family radical SAM enzyme
MPSSSDQISALASAARKVSTLPRGRMTYDIEADWILSNTCNYRCEYCFAPPHILGEKLQIYGAPRDWQAAFAATGLRWLLHITGGEPSIYPSFVELCERLTEQNFISLNSNLTHASLRDFAERIDPQRVNFINAGFHLEERARRSGDKIFLTHAETLLARGFPLFVSLVATPSALERFDDAIEILAPLGLMPVPKLFRGIYGGKVYPQAYSSGDKRRFIARAREAEAHYAPLLGMLGERPTIDVFSDSTLLEGEPTFLGQDCDAGYRFVRIVPNGDVTRCGPPLLGNLLAGTFKPRTGSAICDTQFCYYFCQKYTGTARESRAAAAPWTPELRRLLTGMRSRH